MLYAISIKTNDQLSMIAPSIFTWIIAIGGAITFLPLMVAQLFMLINPNGQNTKDLIIGKGEDWRDVSHFKYSLAFAWADWLVILPLLISANIGVFMGELWGYILWLMVGVISIYFSIVFWVLERKISISSNGRIAYFTYVWGFFLYWGIGASIYSLLVLASH